MSDTIDCPRCGEQHTPDCEDKDGMVMWCWNCEFEFTIHVEVQPVYSTTCKTHEWTDWEEFSYLGGQKGMVRVCKHCPKTEREVDGHEQ